MRGSVPLGPGRELKATAAKHSENRLKFCGHAFGISSGESTWCTARNWELPNPSVTMDMILAGEGKTVPFVPSAQRRAREPSNTSCKE